MKRAACRPDPRMGQTCRTYKQRGYWGGGQTETGSLQPRPGVGQTCRKYKQRGYWGGGQIERGSL